MTARDVWAWVKRIAIGIGSAVALVFAVIYGRRIVARIRAMRGSVYGEGIRWDRLPGDDRHIAVRTEEGWKSAELPEGITPDDIRAVGWAEGGAAVKVEVRRAENTDPTDPRAGGG